MLIAPRIQKLDHDMTEQIVADIVSETRVPASTRTPDSNVNTCTDSQWPRIEIAPTSAAEDETIVMTLVDIVNAVYAKASGDL